MKGTITITGTEADAAARQKDELERYSKKMIDTDAVIIMHSLIQFTDT